MTRMRRLVLKISVRNKWQFTLIRKKLTPRAGIIQWRLNKLEDGTAWNKKKLSKDKWELVQSSAKNVFLSGTPVRGTGLTYLLNQTCPVAAMYQVSKLQELQLGSFKVFPQGAHTAVEEK